MDKGEEAVWYAMRATYRRELLVKQMLDKQSIGNFIPMRYEIKTIRHRKVRQLVPVIHNLVFVYATASQIKKAKDEMPYLQYIIDSRSKQKMIIPDAQMRSFIAISGTYDDQLLYFSPEEVNLAKGTKVRIIGGELDGQEGVFVKVKGARDKRVVIAIQGVIAVAMATLHPDLIEVIP